MKESVTKYSNFDDNELVKSLEKSRKEAEGAFTEIYDRYSKKIFSYIIKIVNNRDHAEDIFQETFIRFFQNVRSNYRGGSIIGFLITISRNLCLNYKRDRKSNIPIEDFEFLIKEKVLQEDRELEELVKMSLELLDMEYREPLVLRIYDGLRYDEIAEICGTTVGNARLRVYRAKEKLKDILMPYLKDFIS